MFFGNARRREREKKHGELWLAAGGNCWSRLACRAPPHTACIATPGRALPACNGSCYYLRGWHVALHQLGEKSPWQRVRSQHVSNRPISSVVMTYFVYFDFNLNLTLFYSGIGCILLHCSTLFMLDIVLRPISAPVWCSPFLGEFHSK